MSIDLQLPLSTNKTPEPQPHPEPETWLPVIHTYDDDQAIDDGFKVEITHTPRNDKRFELGRTFITSGAKEFLESINVAPGTLLARHQAGVWGDLDNKDLAANESALKHGDRLFSSYKFNQGNDKVWVITEWDRSSSTILLPEEY